MTKRTSTVNKTRPSSDAMNVLTNNLEFEMELYNIALQRFYQIKRSLLLENQIPSFLQKAQDITTQL